MTVKFSGALRDDPIIKNLLSRMPKEVQDSFSEEQLSHLKNAVAARQWGHHKVDVRGTVKGLKHRYYYVFLAGKNTRELSREEERASKAIRALLVTLFLAFCTLTGLLILYIIKSALGINLFEDFSLGLWDWLRS